MQLVIAEKPKLGKNIVAALEMNGESFQYEGTDKVYISKNYIVASCVGHLYELYEIEMYAPHYDKTQKKKWSMDILPFCPEQNRFQFKAKEEMKDVISSIAKYALDPRITNIIHMGDADREGEIIVRIVLGMIGNKKPILRPWAKAQEPTVIQEALRNMMPDNEYNNLASAGFARMYIDWLWGINLTRFVSLKAGTIFHVGRVSSAIIKIIYDRDLLIKNFSPVPYYALYSSAETKGEEISLISSRKFKKEELLQAEKLCTSYNQWGATVINKKEETKIRGKPKLFSQTTLQNILSQRFGYSPEATLKLVQQLYDDGFISYPRTPTEYLATSEMPMISTILKALELQGIADLELNKDKSVFDDSKIESHSALTITTKIPSTVAKNKWSTELKNCYNTILFRFLAVFCKENCLMNATTLQIEIGKENDGGEIITLNGFTNIQKGFLKYESGKTEKLLPRLSLYDAVTLHFIPIEKETHPPKHFTVTTLNQFLVNPFQNHSVNRDDDDTVDYKALLSGVEIGTVATRAPTIGQAIARGYLALDKNTYTITKQGILLVELLATLEIDMSTEQTVTLQKHIQSVFNNTRSANDVVTIVYGLIKEIIDSHKELSCDGFNITQNENPIGTCPVCGGQIAKVLNKNNPFYGCSNYKNGCKFTLPSKIKNKELKESELRALLIRGCTNVTGIKFKKGKVSSTIITLSIVDGRSNLNFSFKR